jgi:hexosaminidase
VENLLSIIPRPVSIEYREGFFQSKGLPAITGEDFPKEIELVKEQLRKDTEKSGGVSFDKAGSSLICRKKTVQAANDEAYCLIISKEKITIEAASAKGIYHGLQTFRQLALSDYPQQGGFFTLPCALITDYPRFSWRGFMLDSARYFYSLPFIKRLIDVLSLHHISRFHWHLTDDQGWRLPVAAYPLLVEIGSRKQETRLPGLPYSGGFYSEEDIREIVAFALARHIEIIPEADLPGHASSILASYPGLGCTGGPYRVEDRFGILEEVLCAGNDLIFDLASCVFDVLVKLFPSPYVHIGGDEVRTTRWQACPKCKRRLEKLGLKKAEELQSWITCKLVQLLAERGKTAIGWDEVLDDSSKYALPKETVVMSWRGNKGGERAVNQGHRVIMAPNTNGCYLDYKHIDDPEEPGQLFIGASSVYSSYTMEPVTREMTKEAASLVLGGQCDLWSELIYAGKIAEYMIFPRLCAISEAVWSAKETRDFEDFSRRLAVHQKRLDRLGVLHYAGALR